MRNNSSSFTTPSVHARKHWAQLGVVIGQSLMVADPDKQLVIPLYTFYTHGAQLSYIAFWRSSSLGLLPIYSNRGEKRSALQCVLGKGMHRRERRKTSTWSNEIVA